MISPFHGFANTALQFPTLTDLLERDEAGNVRAIAGPPLLISANLKQLSLFTASQAIRQPGVNDSAILLQGWCVEPMILPLTIRANTWAIATWSSVEGHFYLNAPLNPPYGREGIGAVVEAEAGTKISGWFQEFR